MGITQGLKKASIYYTTLHSGVEFKKDTFETIQQLAQFFQEHKRAGEVVGYVIVKNRQPGFRDYMINGKLTVEWWDANGYASKDFDHVSKMLEFFHENPVIGLALKYERKLKHRT